MEKFLEEITTDSFCKEYAVDISQVSWLIVMCGMHLIKTILLIIFQVPLGVLMKSEVNYEDMTDILEHYQKYVPSVPCETSIPETGTVQDKKFLTTLVGGDYLTVARARGAQIIRSTSELTEDSLQGLFPVAEDWHAKVCLMEV